MNPTTRWTNKSPSRRLLLATGLILGLFLFFSIRLFGAPPIQETTVSAVTFVPDGQTLVAGTWRIENDELKGNLIFYNVKKGVVASRIPIDDGVLSISCSPNGKIVAAGTEGGVIYIFDVVNGKQIDRFGSGEAILSLAFSPDNLSLAAGKKVSANDGCDIAIWDIKLKKQSATLSGHKGSVSSLQFVTDGSEIMLASASFDKTIKLWDLKKNSTISTLESENKRGIRSISVHSSMLASAGSKSLYVGEVAIWNYPKREFVTSFTAHKGVIRSIAFSPDGKLLITGSSDTTLKLFSTDKFVELTTFRGHEKDVECVCFSPDGTTVASGAADGTLRIWSLKEKKMVANIDVK